MIEAVQPGTLWKGALPESEGQYLRVLTAELRPEHALCLYVYGRHDMAHHEPARHHDRMVVITHENLGRYFAQVMLCDFCGSNDAVWHYPCSDTTLTAEGLFETPRGTLEARRGPTANTQGAWAACAECAALIEQREVRALAKRSADEIGRRHFDGDERYGDEVTRHLLAMTIDYQQEAFWSARSGERQAIEEDV